MQTDSEAVAPRSNVNEKAKKVHRAVLASLPPDWQTSFRPYVRTYIHAVGYVAVLIASYKYQEVLHQLSLRHTEFSWYLNPYSAGKYLLAPVVAWSLHSLVMVGHDAVHGALAPSKSRIGNLLQYVAVKATWDCLVGTNVQPDHLFHHKYLNTKEDTAMIMVDMGFDQIGLSTIGEVLHTAWKVVKWNLEDTFELLNVAINPLTGSGLKRWIVHKPWIALTLVGRLALYSGIYVDVAETLRSVKLDVKEGVTGVSWKLRPLIGAANVMCTAYMFNIFAFSPHISPKKSQEISTDQYVNKLRNTWETYPDDTWHDRVQQWIHCGLTMHATHHCFSFLPRSLMHIASKELKKAYPEEYRCIDNMSDELKVWRERKVFSGAYDINETKFMRDEAIEL